MAVAGATGLDWVRSLARFGIRPGLERTLAVLAGLGDPQRELRFLHVAGTNGKGSVCAVLAALLSVRLSVGSFTSPARDYRARFVVNGVQPDPDLLWRLAEEVRVVASRELQEESLTEFEALTVMALVHFARCQVDVVVWETGLGGRFDSTNVVVPLAAVVTNVGRDHMEILGDTLWKVGRDKAGIAKPGIPLVTGAADEGGLSVASTARQTGAQLLRLGREFAAAAADTTPDGQTCHYRGIGRDLYELKVPLFGRHQCDNAALALAVWELACARGLPAALTDDEVRDAVSKVKWPGRFELRTERGVSVILDGAHNPEAGLRLSEALSEWSRVTGVDPADWTLVVGMLESKDAGNTIHPVLARAARVIVTEPPSKRARPAPELAKVITNWRPQARIRTVVPVSEAMQAAISYGRPVCCFGSLYTVDAARESMENTAMRLASVAEVWADGGHEEILQRGR